MSSSVALSTTLLTNLSSLKSTQSLLDDTEYKVTTGRKVNSAIDDPVSYFKSEDHLSNASDLQALKDDMSESLQTIKAATTGIESIMDLISDAKSLATSALTATEQSDIDSYTSEYNDLLAQIDDLAADSGYNGLNLLGGTANALSVKFDAEGDSTMSVTGVDASASGLSISSLTTSNAWGTTASSTFTLSKTNIEASIANLNAAKSSLRADTKTLSNQSSVITTRQDYTDSMVSTLQTGSANLVNADQNEESVKLTTLQTQQQLAISSLSISKSASQAILSLLQ